jgi:hypothetical protein
MRISAVDTTKLNDNNGLAEPFLATNLMLKQLPPVFAPSFTYLPVLLQGEKKEEKYCFRTGFGGELRR